MFDTVHDAILLLIALVYVLVGISRAILGTRPIPPGYRYPPGWFGVPFGIAAALTTVAILW